MGAQQRRGDGGGHLAQPHDQFLLGHGQDARGARRRFRNGRFRQVGGRESGGRVSGQGQGGVYPW